MDTIEHELYDGRTLVIRAARVSDAELLVDYVEGVSGESDFLTFGPGEFAITLEKEREYLEAIAKSPNECYLVALIDGNLVATINFKGGPRPRIRHAGELGISVRKAEWGKGIGCFLMEALIAWARSTGTIRKLDLRVRVDNARAIGLYRKLGFEVEGRIRDELQINGRYYDLYAMGLVIKK